MRFICKTNLSGLRRLSVDGKPVLEFYEQITKFIKERVGPNRARLLAEPVISKSDDGVDYSVAWYGEYRGDVVRLTELQGERRQNAERQLDVAYKSIIPILSNGEFVPQLFRALHITELKDVIVTADGIILTNWGLVPEIVEDNDESLSRHFSSTLGTVSGLTALTALIGGEQENEKISSATLSKNSGKLNVSGIPRVVDRRKRLIGIGALGLLFGVFIGWWLFSSEINSLSDRKANSGTGETLLSLQKGINDGLERELSSLENKLNGNVCKAEMPYGLVQPSDPKNNKHRDELVKILNQSTVFIIAEKEKGWGSGTGFFVAPSIIVTNAHVVKNSISGKVWITNKTLGKLHKVEISSIKGGEKFSGSDFAILRVSESKNIQAFTFSKHAQALDRVVSAGFPEIVIKFDEAYNALISGDQGAVPEIVVTAGEVSAIHQTTGGMTSIAHTADISPGNSGGPLVDLCGRIVGINTWVTFNKDSVSKFDFAIAVQDIVEFLKEEGVTVNVTVTPCDN